MEDEETRTETKSDDFPQCSIYYEVLFGNHRCLFTHTPRFGVSVRLFSLIVVSMNVCQGMRRLLRNAAAFLVMRSPVFYSAPLISSQTSEWSSTYATTFFTVSLDLDLRLLFLPLFILSHKMSTSSF